ncbi:MAG: NUDIX hydrolase [Candidatus Margulisiibacteriota bacterium]|nr:MAG: NUDIX hydrolase [Candidatus Margulisbacteria bacterium GWD2_39_127]OGI02800.1 MAG: NUDIX hydrolase [Candidatus Margulisbacteria bacterium GWF2_38_17]OGI09389.1 MAG: NUDIX hydrolase [Candidatus Margulisbacteria bacterium GWE2_39_32]PZM84972.1 MAG: NUDIX hydrolase [Candidatus Margulisiibacteriota bacterium]HAR63648.1 NUDIX hydrolase [Candidatus Margulisiibacteriota bacterium]
MPRKLDRTVIYENPWVNLYVDKVEFPDGRIVNEHHFLDFEKEAVAAIVENEKNEILMVKAYRYVIGCIDWEVPAGLIEKGESIINAAQREVMEESGYKTLSHHHIYTFYPMSGLANKVFHVVKCKSGKTTGVFDKNEVKEYGWFSEDVIRQMIQKKEIKDGLTLNALLIRNYLK